jgi:amino-acid N-acetyltransferase
MHLAIVVFLLLVLVDVQSFVPLVNRKVVRVPTKTFTLVANDVVFVEGEEYGLNSQPGSSDTSESTTKNELLVANNAFLDSSNFGAIFRQCAPYIATHRGTLMVIHIPGHVLADPSVFQGVIDDIGILHLLGVRLILVAGVREQLEWKLQEKGVTSTFVNGMHVTDEARLGVLKEVSGTARFDIECALARRSVPGQRGINVVSGNFFYSAQPIGVQNGVDFRFTGKVRKVEEGDLNDRLSTGDVILLTSLGYSPSGEVFNIHSESLAAEIAARMSAAKVLFLAAGRGLVDTKTDAPVQSLRIKDAENLLAAMRADTAMYAEGPGGEDFNNPTAAGTTLTKDPVDEVHMGNKSKFLSAIARCVYALKGGVRRAHIIQPDKGAMLKELYTRDGNGLLIARDVYEGIRQAEAVDVPSVMEILAPLEKKGVLVHRPAEQLEQEMKNTFVLVRDGTILALGMLKKYSTTHAEIACLAVRPGFQRAGRGETMLSYLERRAITQGIKNVFLLSTQTMQWFEERGFEAALPDMLPSTRSYNTARGSKGYIKQLNSMRDLDVEETLWDIF